MENLPQVEILPLVNIPTPSSPFPHGIPRAKHAQKEDPPESQRPGPRSCRIAQENVWHGWKS